jgi:hypothetical protein
MANFMDPSYLGSNQFLYGLMGGLSAAQPQYRVGQFPQQVGVGDVGMATMQGMQQGRQQDLRGQFAQRAQQTGYSGLMDDPQAMGMMGEMNPAIIIQQATALQAAKAKAAATAQEGSLNRETTLQAAKIKAGLGDGGEAPPFRGTSMDAQTMNILLDPNADTNSPKYRAAYAHAAQPKVVPDPATGMITTVSPDMSAFRRPGGGAAAPAAANGGSSFAVPGGTVTQTPGKPLEKFTDAQGRAAGFADRMDQSLGILEKVEGEGASLKGRSLEEVPGGNYLQSDQYQSFEQARRDFINAQLRRESGAVINPEEFVNADRQYFPAPGDKPDVIAQKKANRKAAYEAMKRDAGPAYKSKGGKGELPPISERTIGKTYDTPRGKAVWRGTGWELQ